MTLSTIGLLLDGDLDLNGDNVDPSGLAFRIEALGPGTTWGNPVGIARLVSSWLADGSIVTHDRDDNREVSVPVRIMADTSAGLAAGEAALFHRCNRPTTLAWTPPWDDASPVTTVFEVWTAALDGDLQAGEEGDLNELRLTRYYTLTLTAKPYSRSAALVKFAALSKPATEATVQIDDCSSTTGWTGSPSSAATTGIAVTETVETSESSRRLGGREAGGATYHLSLTRTGAVDMTDYPYLRVNFSMPGVSWDPKVHADGVLLTQVASSGRIRWYKAPASFSTLKVGGSFFTNRALTVVLSVFNVSQTNVAGVVYPGGKELARSAWIEGSARTGGSIAVEHATTGLGTVVVYTAPASPAGYVPAMSGYWTAGPTRASDAAAVTGQKTPVDHSSIGATLPTFTIPGDQVIEADYGVMVRLKADTPADYGLQLIAYLDGHSLVVEEAQITPVVSPADTSYHLYWLGRMTLPPLAIPSTSAHDMVVTIQAYNPTSPFTATDTVYLDEIWLFNLTDGAVSIIEAGSSQRVWLDSADGERPNPTIWLGTAADRSDAVAAALTGNVRAMGSHDLIPGYMDLYTVTTDAADADASISYYPRWHTHAAL